MYNTTNLVDIDSDPDQRDYAHVIPFVQTKIEKPIKLSAEFLGAADIDAFIAIQNKIRPFLLQPHHLKERSPEDIQAHLAERMPLIGARAYTNELQPGSVVAGCLLSFLKNHDEENTAIKNVNGYPVDKAEYPITAIVQSLCVDPAFERRGLSQMVLEAARFSAQQHGMTQIISAIADDNRGSICTFEKAGYKLFAHGADPEKGYDKSFYRLCIG
jgi:RimJ/RimL family protein N-acetyltransferase